MRAYIDTDILIWFLRGENRAMGFLEGLRVKGEYELWTGAMQRAEVVFFMRPDEERMTIAFLSHFKTAAVDLAVVDSAAGLYRRWHPGHGVDINDCILAATALHTGGKIYCLNVRHYPMPDLVVERAW